MKKNTFKLVAFFLGAAVVVSSCVKTEELDSVKAMREAKVDNIVAGTAKLNADAALADANAAYRLAEVNTKLIQNRYDSANYSFTLLTNKAVADYNVAVKAAETTRDVAIAIARSTSDAAQYAAAEAQYNANILVLQAKRDADIQLQKQYLAQYKRDEQVAIDANITNIQNAKNTLLTYQNTFIALQQANYAAKIAAQKDSIDKSNDNKVAVDLYNDYNAYYNNGTLSSGVVIGAGIFSLKQTILTDKNTLLITNKANQENQIKTNNDQITNYLDQVRTDSLAIVAENKLIAIYTNAKTAANYDAAIKSINDLLIVASADFTTKEIEWKKQTEILDELTTAYTVANTANAANLTAKGNAKTAYEAILALYTLVPTNTYEGFLVKKSELAADLSAKQGTYNTWKTKFDAALSALNSAKSTKNTAQIAKDAADAAVSAAQINGGTATQAQLDAQTTATTNLNTATTNLGTKQTEYDNVFAQYSPAETAYKSALTANDSIVARDGRYLISKAKYDACVAAEAGLKSTLDTKLAAKNAQQLVVTAANTAQLDAKALYTTYNGGKTALEGLTLVSDAAIKISALDDKIAASNKAITLKNSNIADIKLKIARVNDNLFKFDDEIAKLNEVIAVNEALVAKYEAAAAAIKAKIDLL